MTWWWIAMGACWCRSKEFHLLRFVSGDAKTSLHLYFYPPGCVCLFLSLSSESKYLWWDAKTVLFCRGHRGLSGGVTFSLFVTKINLFWLVGVSITDARSRVTNKNKEKETHWIPFLYMYINCPNSRYCDLWWHQTCWLSWFGPWFKVCESNTDSWKLLMFHCSRILEAIVKNMFRILLKEGTYSPEITWVLLRAEKKKLTRAFKYTSSI